jgi:hypothetical protein
MAGQIVEMDYPTMQNVAKGFRTQAEVMNVIGKTAVALFESLEKSLWFTGLGAYFGRCKEATKKKTKELVDHLNEFGKDIDDAVQDHKNGDFEGKSYFGKQG